MYSGGPHSVSDEEIIIWIIIFLWIVFDLSPLFCKHKGVGQNNVNTWEIGNISLLRIFWPSLKRCNLWIVSRVSSIETSSSCFRDVEGRNRLLTLLTKTVHSGLIIFKSGKSSGQGRCWSSFWGSNCPGFMTATPLINIRAISALSWMLVFVKFSAWFKQKILFQFFSCKIQSVIDFFGIFYNNLLIFYNNLLFIHLAMLIHIFYLYLNIWVDIHI